MKNENEKIVKVLSLEEFIKKTTEKCCIQKQEEMIEIPECGKIPFTRPTNDQVLDYLNAQGNSIKFNKDGVIEGTDLRGLSEAAAQFIYFTCPYLQNTDFQESLDIKDPLDMSIKVFGIENVIDIANLIQKKFGIEKKIKRSIKN